MNNQFLAISFFAALVGSYALPADDIEHEHPFSELLVTTPPETSPGTSMGTLEAALPGVTKNKEVMGLLTGAVQAKTGFDTTAIVRIVDNIMKQLKDKYDTHRADVLKQIKKLIDTRSAISDAQYKPLSSAAKKWCTSHKTQQDSKKLLRSKEATMKNKKKQKIPNPKQWNEACTWGISESTFKKGDEKTLKYKEKTFSATTAFQNEFNLARKAYWLASKAHYQQNAHHVSRIQESNKVAVVFKTSIDTLATFEVNECKKPASTEKGLVDAFNKANAGRASVHRSLKVLVCTLRNMSKANPTQETATCVRQLKTTAQYKASIFKDLAVPTLHCPSKADVLEKIKTTKPNLNFHFKGSKTSDATDSSGTLVANQGWTPLAGACAKVPSSVGSWKLELGWCRENRSPLSCGGGCTCDVALSGIGKLSFKEEAAKCEALAGTYKPATAIEVIGSRYLKKAQVTCHIMCNSKVKPTKCPPAACASGWTTWKGHMNVKSYNGIDVSNWGKSRLENRINCAIRQA